MEREGSELRCELTRYGFKVGDVVYDRCVLRVSVVSSGVGVAR